VTSDNPSLAAADPSGSTSDNTTARRGRAPVALPAGLATIDATYAAQLAAAPLGDATRRAYRSRVRQYLAWLADTGDIHGDPLADPHARDGAVRDYRTHLQITARQAPATINLTLAALTDFYTRQGLGAPAARRLDLPQRAPRALTGRDVTRWLRVTQRWLNPRDRVLALLPFYAGLRIGETVALDLHDIRLSARKGLITVRSGKGDRYREIPAHPELRDNLAVWIDDERPGWPGADTNPALLLNHRGKRLSPRGARDILTAIADDAGVDPDFTSHTLRHTFATNLVRDGHDLVLVADLLGHQRLETTRGYSLPTAEDRQRAINSLPTDH
jgi:site-specific recombinase XerD